VDFFREKLHEAVGHLPHVTGSLQRLCLLYFVIPQDILLYYFVSQVQFNPQKVLRKRNKMKKKMAAFLMKIHVQEVDVNSPPSLRDSERHFYQEDS